MITNVFLRKQVGVVASVVSETTMRTLYSYLISGIRKINFKELVLLAKMSRLFRSGARQKKLVVTGWMMHDLMGLPFAEAHAPFW